MIDSNIHNAQLENFITNYNSRTDLLKAPVNLAQILSSAGLLDTNSLTKACQIAAAAGAELDTVLMKNGFVTVSQYENTLKANRFLKNNPGLEDVVFAGLRIAFKKDLSLEAALHLMGRGW